MSTLYGYLLASIFLTGLLSCKNKQEDFIYKAPVKSYGTIKKMELSAHPNESYVLYLPVHYNEEKAYPIILCFSPDGDGLTPVENLRFAAETFGFIVAGSNVVKNNFEGNGEAIRSLIYDLQNQFAVDASRIYACGFSGGARLATVLGNQEVVTGVISCGAGPGNYSETKPYPWYGIVGKTDFNYNEFLHFTPKVMQKPFYTVAYHPGGHEWPDSSFLYDAVAYMQIQAHKSNLIDVSYDLFKNYQNYMLDRVDSLKAWNRYLEAFQQANDAATLLSGLIKTDELLKEAEDIYQSSSYKASAVQQEELDKLFNEIMKIYPVALVKQDTSWWKKELDRLESRESKAQGEALYTFKRIKSTLGILCYSVAGKLLQNNSPSLQNVLEVYALLEPNNSDLYYFKSKYESKKGNNEAAAKYLQRAKELGFSDS